MNLSVTAGQLLSPCRCTRDQTQRMQIVDVDSGSCVLEGSWSSSTGPLPIVRRGMHRTSVQLLRWQACCVNRGLRVLRTDLCTRNYKAQFHNQNSSSTGMGSWTTLPWQGNLKNMDTLPTLQELHDLLQTATASVRAYQQANPSVQNLNKLANRIKRDLMFIESQKQLLAQQESQLGELKQAQQDASSSPGGLGEGRLQGIVNNLRGFHGELLALHEAPGVIAVCQKVSSAPPKIWAPACSISQHPAPQSAQSKRQATSTTAVADTTAGLLSGQQQDGRGLGDGKQASRAEPGVYPGDRADNSDDGVPGFSFDSDSASSELEQRHHHSNGTGVRGTRTYTLFVGAEVTDSSGQMPNQATADSAGAAAPLWVEVDVVANDGLTWIEVKNQERFGLESVHWLGSPGRSKGLAQQIADLKAVAAAPHNSRRWRAPELVVFFPSAADSCVSAALRGMGVTVAVGPGSLSSLPVPRPPRITNLDVTSLCALVSEVSWGDPHSQHMQQWAARTTHWQECLAAQIARPLLPELHACLDHSQQLVTSCAAVEQFQKLMGMFAGPVEQQRWQELQQRLQVYHNITGKAGAASKCVVCGTSLGSRGGDSIAAADGHIHATAGATSGDYQLECDVQCGSELKGREDNPATIFGASNEPQQQPMSYGEPERISRLDKLTQQQKAVLGLGDALEALTLTANGSSIRCCEQYGVKLEAVVHRPVWLTGM